jgi:acetyl esterase/lipase
VHGFPPTLFLSSTRDMLLSGTTMLQRHFYESGVEAPMVIFEGLPHAFWNNMSLPESREAFGVMAKFLDAKVER